MLLQGSLLPASRNFYSCGPYSIRVKKRKRSKNEIWYLWSTAASEHPEEEEEEEEERV